MMDGQIGVGDAWTGASADDVFPGAGYSWKDLQYHYALVAERIEVAVKDRRLALSSGAQHDPQAADWRSFDANGAEDTRSAREMSVPPDGSAAAAISESGDIRGLLEYGRIEAHMAGYRLDRPDRPDRLVFDLHPGGAVAWRDVCAAAVEIGDRLQALGITAGAIVTGGRGVHVWVPLRRTVEWDTLKAFAARVARVLAEEDADHFCARPPSEAGAHQIAIDWFRNDPDGVAVAPYSLRARPGAPVAMPVTWEELKELEGADAFRMADLEARLSRDCPYLALADDLQSITRDSVEQLQSW